MRSRLEAAEARRDAFLKHEVATGAAAAQETFVEPEAVRETDADRGPLVDDNDGVAPEITEEDGDDTGEHAANRARLESEEKPATPSTGSAANDGEADEPEGKLMRSGSLSAVVKKEPAEITKDMSRVSWADWAEEEFPEPKTST